MKYILTDIEGTTSSISFVHEVLFPYSAKKMAEFVKHNQLKLEPILDLIDGDIDQKIATLLGWIKEDKKEKALKDIQGLIWEEGYLAGEIKGHVYPEVKNCLVKWKSQGITLGVYSSGSVHAQKLLFKYSEAGNLDILFSDNFDTSIGHKRDKNSYQNILNLINIPASEVLFLSDIKEELDAAKECGINTIQLNRLNQLVTNGHVLVSSFDDIKF